MDGLDLSRHISSSSNVSVCVNCKAAMIVDGTARSIYLIYQWNGMQDYVIELNLFASMPLLVVFLASVDSLVVFLLG